MMYDKGSQGSRIGHPSSTASRSSTAGGQLERIRSLANEAIELSRWVQGFINTPSPAPALAVAVPRRAR